MNLPDVFKRRAWSVQDLIREPADVYHAQAGKYLSSHQLADFRRNPLLFRKKELGLVQDEDRPAYVVGRAAHVLILEGREAYERPVRLRRADQPEDRRSRSAAAPRPSRNGRTRRASPCSTTSRRR